MIRTSAVDTSIHDTSPLFGAGAGAAAGAAAGADAAGATGADVWSPKANNGDISSSTTLKAPSSFFRLNDVNMEFSPVSKRIFAGFTGADTHDLFEVSDKDFSITDLVGAGGL